MTEHPLIGGQVAQLRHRWPQSHAVALPTGAHLIIIPSVRLPQQYRETICTVLFIAPPGYPGAQPDHFFTDITVRLRDGSLPHNTLDGERRRWDGSPFGGNFPAWAGEQWRRAMWWSWHLQSWNPNSDTLFTFANAVRRRFVSGGPATPQEGT